MPLTDTTRQTSTPPTRPVTFVYPTPEKPFITQIIIPEHSRWSPSPHWHERYTEHFRVIKGRARLIVDGRQSIITQADGEQSIEKFNIHEFMRADVDAVDGEGDDGDVIVEERTDPDEADGSKEIFFRNVFSALQDAEKVFGRLLPLQITLTCAYLDNCDVYVAGPLNYYVTHMVHLLARLCGPAFGLRPWYKEYTPERLRSAALELTGVKSKMS